MKLPRPDSIASVLFIALLVFFAYGCEKDCPEPIQVLNSCFIDPQGWHSPSLTKEELKALDLKLRQEAITFREGERVVYLPTTQTAIILDFATQLRGRGYQTALIQFEKSIETKTVSAFDLVKIGEDYVEPKPKPIWLVYYNGKDKPDTIEIGDKNYGWVKTNPERPRLFNRAEWVEP